MPGMKVKQTPEDFRVEELTSASSGGEGERAFYQLDRTGGTTPDALAPIRRPWKTDPRRAGSGGLNARHPVTSQYLTIFRGPELDCKHERNALTYLGRRAEAFTSSDI